MIFPLCYCRSNDHGFAINLVENRSVAEMHSSGSIMNLRILGRATRADSVRYRGTDRTTPYYDDNVPIDHPANQAFFWYANSEDGEIGIVHDLARAQELVDIYKRLTPPQFFEIVEETLDAQPPFIGKTRLGYDISTVDGISLLSSGLDIDRTDIELAPDDTYWTLLPLLTLIKVHFQPLLNSNGLFDTYTDAELCLNSMMALQRFRPGLWENENVVFRVVCVWSVERA